MREEKLLRNILKDNDLKVTQPRLAVFRLLLSKKPKSLAELTTESQGKIDRVSVYRIIDLYERLGVVRRVALGWKYKIELSEIFSDHHHHIVCLQCNKVVAVHENEASKKVINDLALGTGFAVTSHQLELQGYCPKCYRHTV